jgi:hypothetical protein
MQHFPVQKALTATYDHAKDSTANSVVAVNAPRQNRDHFQCMHNEPKQKTVRSLVLNVSSFPDLEITDVSTLQN